MGTDGQAWTRLRTLNLKLPCWWWKFFLSILWGPGLLCIKAFQLLTMPGAPGIVAACAHVASPQHSPTNIACCLQPTERVLSQNSLDTEVKI